MSSQERELRIRRILVALDASPHSLTALEAAVELADSLGAEVMGLFVEDVNLLRAAELPFAREMGFLSARSRAFDSQYLRRQLRAHASRARRALVRMAERTEVPWSFQIAQGVIAAEVLAAAADADLIVLGRRGCSVTGRRRLGSTARTLVIQTNRLTMVLQQGTRLGLPLLVAYDGTQVAQKALDAAAHLMQEREGPLAVLILADDSEAAQDLQMEARERLRERGLTARYRWLTEVDEAALARLITEEGCRVLVLPTPLPGLSSETLPTLFERLDCPVLLVR